MIDGEVGEQDLAAGAWCAGRPAGRGDAQLHHAPQQQDHGRRGEQAERGAGGPAPVAALGDRAAGTGRGRRTGRARPAGRRCPRRAPGTPARRVRVRTMASDAEAGRAEKRACQSACWATSAAAGSARPPPTPMEELIRAIAEPSFSRGSMSRIRPMPSGIAPIAKPWSVRPTIIDERSLVDALIRAPTTITARLTSSMRRLPYRSPSRPMIGVATAPDEQGRGQDPGGVGRGGVQQARQVLDDRDEQGLHHRDDDAREGEHRDHGPARSAGWAGRSSSAS